jgi:hypothetical protein
MKRALWVLLAAATIAGAYPASLRAEIYMGIRPFDTLGDVKNLFPNATFRDLKPAWATPENRLVGIKGAGISGEIIVLFYDPRPGDKEFLSKNPDSILTETITKDAQRPDDQALQVEWVRWAPDGLGVPVTRLVSKYGAAFEKGYSDSDFSPFRRWKPQGVTAYLDDDEKSVVRVDFTFTPAEQCAAAKTRKYNDQLIEHFCKGVK